MPLQFYGGLTGALLPFALFLAGVGALALNGAPDEKGFWPVLLAALMLGLLLAKDRARYADAMLDGMSQRVVMVMLCAWLFAGVLGSVLSAAGFVTALASLARAMHVSGGAYVAAAFVACMLVSTATGTSFGTILLCGPLLYPAGGGAGAAPAALMGAILAGATFGDSISPVSDTTIASSGSQHVDIAGTVRTRLRYVLPAGAAAIALSALLGGRNSAWAGGAPAQALALAGADPFASTSVSLTALVLLLAPAVVIALLLARRHLIEALLSGIAAAVSLALMFGLIAPRDVLQIAPGSYSATGIIVDGMQRAVGVSVFTLLLVALVGALQATDVMDRLVRAARGRASTPRAAESWIVGVVSAAVLLTTHSVVAILAVGEFARQTGDRFGIGGYRRANLLDMTVCTWPFLLPYFLPTILAASASTSGMAYGMPALSAGTIGLHNTYAWMLTLAILVAVVTGVGRSGEAVDSLSGC